MHARARTQVLVSQWFLTLFSYSLRPPTLLRVLDLTFTDGWKAMFRFGLARLRSVEVSGVGFEQQKQRGGPGDGRRPGRRGGGVAFILVWFYFIGINPVYIHMYVAVCTCTESMSDVEKGVVIVKGGLKKKVDESAMHLPRAPPNTLPVLPKIITVFRKFPGRTPHK